MFIQVLWFLRDNKLLFLSPAGDFIKRKVTESEPLKFRKCQTKLDIALVIAVHLDF